MAADDESSLSPPSLPRESEVLLAPAQPLPPPPGRCLGPWSRGCGSPEALGLDLGEPWLPIRSCWPGMGVGGSVPGGGGSPRKERPRMEESGGCRPIERPEDLRWARPWGRGEELEWPRGTRGGGRERGVSVARGVVQSRALRVCTRSANLGPRFR